MSTSAKKRPPNRVLLQIARLHINILLTILNATRIALTSFSPAQEAQIEAARNFAAWTEAEAE